MSKENPAIGRELFPAAQNDTNPESFLQPITVTGPRRPIGVTGGSVLPTADVELKYPATRRGIGGEDVVTIR